MNYREKQDLILRRQLTTEKQIIHFISSKEKKAIPILNELQDKFFLNENYKKIFQIIKNGIISETNYTQKIQKEKLASVYAECMMSEGLYYPEQLKKDLQNNWLEYEFTKIIQDHTERDIEDPTKSITSLWGDLEKISNYQSLEEVDIDFIKGLFDKEQKEYEEKQKNGHKLIGLSCGIGSLDDAVDGLRDGHLWIVGGYTSAGKTQFVLNIAKAFIDQKEKVSVYSLEMSKVDIYKRMLGIITGNNGSYLLKNNSEESKQKREEGFKALKESEMRVHTEKYNIDQILTSMIVEKKTKGTKLFILDYAQLIKAGGSSLYDDMRNIAIRLQNFCRTQNVPMILVSQVSNESAKGGNSAMIGFKGAGDLGASADVAIELESGEEREEREEKIDEGKAVKVIMKVKKNRHGRIFQDDLWFQTKTGQFFNEDQELKNF